MVKSSLLVARIVALALFFSLASALNLFPSASVQSPPLQLVMCDVGQGDALLLIWGTIEILVDGGPQSHQAKLDECLTQAFPAGDTRLELVVATHPDADHIGGLPGILEKYQVAAVLNSPLSRSTKISAAWQEAIKAEKKQSGLLELCPEPLQRIVVAQEVTLWVLYPSCQDIGNRAGGELEDANHFSIVIWISYGQTSALLTGDLDVSAEQALVTQGLITRAQILKVGHHGAKTSTSLGLLAAVQPEIALIGVGRDNTYQHPDSGVLNTLSTLGTRVKRTDLDGTVRLVSDGQKWREESPGR